MFAKQLAAPLAFQNVQPCQQHQLALHQWQEVSEYFFDQGERRVAEQIVERLGDTERIAPLTESHDHADRFRWRRGRAAGIHRRYCRRHIRIVDVAVEYLDIKQAINDPSRFDVETVLSLFVAGRQIDADGLAA